MSTRITEVPPFFIPLTAEASLNYSPSWKGYLLALDKAVNGTQDPPQNITGTSPLTLQNSVSCVQMILVDGGSGVAVSYSQDNSTFYPITGGQFTLFPGDYLKISWTSAPTITRISR